MGDSTEGCNFQQARYQLLFLLFMYCCKMEAIQIGLLHLCPVLLDYR